MRKTLFVASWKTYKTTAKEVQEFMAEFPQFSASFKHEVAICPSFVHLQTAKDMIPSNISLGAQDCSAYAAGPHTGDITAAQLKELGVKYCILGHVERRKDGETDAMINKKIKQAIANGITPIVCFGETLVEYDNDQTRLVLERQMRDCLSGVSSVGDMVLCYMPIWSVGTGFYTTGEYSNIIADFIRKTAARITGNPMAANCTLLFGGQITSSNVKEYLECPEIDGVMFSTAALRPRELSQIVTTPFSVKKLAKME